MKNVDNKEAPAVSGGVKPYPIGDCGPDLPEPEFPRFPTVPLDPEYINPNQG